MAINHEEEILIVDKLGQEIGFGKRADLLSSNSWTRTGNVFVVLGDSVLCHKRAAGVGADPSLWTMTFGGHARPGETPVQTAIKELSEESGLNVKQQDLELVMVYPDRSVNKIKWIYSLRVSNSNLHLQIEEEEVEETAWIETKELEQIYAFQDKSWTQHGYELISLQLLRSNLDNR